MMNKLRDKKSLIVSSGVLALLAGAFWLTSNAAPPDQPENTRRDAIPNLTASPTVSQPIGTDVFDSGRVELLIGPIKHLTTGWHNAPTQTAIPVGSVVLLEANGVDADDVVVWNGAIEVARTSNVSRAICPLVELGANTATVEVNSGGIIDSRQIVFDVVNFDPADITISPIQVQTGSIVIDQSLTGDALNQQTMLYFFGDSIASVTQTGIDQYRTSVDNAIGLSVQVNPLGFAPLMEWRVDGLAKQLGASVGQKISDIGIHDITVGPVLIEEAISVETYRVIITSHVSGDDTIPDGVPVTFEAVTEPPGYEVDIAWLSSTKYGTATPVLGYGATFTTQFDNTWDDSIVSQWLGVKADNVAFGQDQNVVVNANVLDLQNVKIGKMKIFQNGDFIEATFTLNEGFEFLCDWYNFRWINIVTGFAQDLSVPPDGDFTDPGENMANDPVVGALPAIDPQPGDGIANGQPGDLPGGNVGDAAFNDPKPFYYTDAELAGGWNLPFSDNRGEGPGSPSALISFKTYLVVESVTDPGLGAMNPCLLAGFTWTSQTPVGGGAGVEVVTGVIPVPGAADVACVNAAIANATPAEGATFAGWAAVVGCVLNACPP